MSNRWSYLQTLVLFAILAVLVSIAHRLHSLETTLAVVGGETLHQHDVLSRQVLGLGMGQAMPRCEAWQ